MGDKKPDRSAVPDAEIVQLVVAGEIDAFDELVRRTRRPAYRLARRITRNHEDADDVVQRQLRQGVPRPGPIRPGARLPALVPHHRGPLGPERDPPRAAGAPRCRWMSRGRTERRWADRISDTPLDPDALQRLMDAEEALGKLPEEQRAILALRVDGDLPYSEIAGALDIPVGTVMSRLARAREALLAEVGKAPGREVPALMKEDLMHPSSEELFAYRDGELTPDKRAILEAHVSGCSICRALIDQVSALEAELRQAPTAAPPGYLDRLSESVRARVAAASSERAGPWRRRPRNPGDAEVAPRSPGRFKEGDGRGGRAARLERRAREGSAQAAVGGRRRNGQRRGGGPGRGGDPDPPGAVPADGDAHATAEAAQPVTEGTAGVEEKHERRRSGIWVARAICGTRTSARSR